MTPTQIPLRITFRHLTPSSTLEDTIRQRAEWLRTFDPAVIGCRVLVEVPHRHRRRGRPAHIRIEVSVPGEDVVINHAPERHDTLEQGTHDAFDMARRRLEDAARLRRGDVKTAAPANAGAPD
jgi:hypothetical protein